MEMKNNQLAEIVRSHLQTLTHRIQKDQKRLAEDVSKLVNIFELLQNVSEIPVSSMSYYKEEEVPLKVQNTTTTDAKSTPSLAVTPLQKETKTSATKKSVARKRRRKENDGPICQMMKSDKNPCTIPSKHTINGLAVCGRHKKQAEKQAEKQPAPPAAKQKQKSKRRKKNPESTPEEESSTDPASPLVVTPVPIALSDMAMSDAVSTCLENYQPSSEYDEPPDEDSDSDSDDMTSMSMPSRRERLSQLHC